MGLTTHDTETLLVVTSGNQEGDQNLEHNYRHNHHQHHHTVVIRIGIVTTVVSATIIETVKTTATLGVQLALTFVTEILGATAASQECKEGPGSFFLPAINPRSDQLCLLC